MYNNLGGRAYILVCTVYNIIIQEFVEENGK
jgi:hypothetical protein